MNDADACNSEWAIELARPIAELALPAFAVALASTPGQEWRSPNLQVAFLTGEIAAALDKARDEAIVAERERCATLIEEGFEKVVGESYAPGRKSKNDKCPHGRYIYEDCDQCCADAIRNPLSPLVLDGDGE